MYTKIAIVYKHLIVYLVVLYFIEILAVTPLCLDNWSCDQNSYHI